MLSSASASSFGEIDDAKQPRVQPSAAGVLRSLTLSQLPPLTRLQDPLQYNEETGLDNLQGFFYFSYSKI